MKHAILICALFFSAAAHAADEASLREARALIDLMHMDQQLEGMSGAMSQAMTRELGPMGGNPRVAQIIMGETMAVMKDRALRPGGMIDAAVEAYADTFSADELRDMRRFYESPTGRKMIERTPQLMGRVMQTGMGMAREAYPEVCERAKSRLAAEGMRREADNMRCTLPPMPPGPPSRPAPPAPPAGSR